MRTIAAHGLGAAMMDSLATTAANCHEHADKTRALALVERDHTKRVILFAISEQFYLLHEQLVELNHHLLAVHRNTNHGTVH